MRTRVLLGLLAATALQLPAAASAGPTATTVTVYQAFTPSGQIKFATRTVSGMCGGGSDVIDRSDAWRCYSGNGILDPCFSPPQGNVTVLACPTSPVASVGYRFVLTKPLPLNLADQKLPSPQTVPWAIQLENGSVYLWASGGTAVVDRQRANYFGPGGAAFPVLWGNPNRNTQPWTIFSARFSARTLTEHVVISHVWT